VAQRIVTHDCRLNASSQRLHSHDPRFFVTVQLKIRIGERRLLPGLRLKR